MRLAALILVAMCARAWAGDCTSELDARHVSWKKASVPPPRLSRDGSILVPGIANAVEITGPLGGVEVTGDDEPLVIDCSLAVSLDEAGHYLRALGITKAHFASAYSRRKVRFTDHWSKHSFGLAIDISTFTGPDLGTLRVDRDFEQGLGDDMDCVGEPLTQAGAVLEILKCQLVRSGLFHLVLSPDYDDAHHDHFHLEALPWSDRPELRSALPAIH